MKVECFRRNEKIDEIYEKYSSYFVRSDDLLIPEDPIERYLLVKEPSLELERILNDYIETLDRDSLELEFIERMAYNKFINLSDEEKKHLSIFPNLSNGFEYIFTRNEVMNSIPLDFWVISEFETEASKIDLLLIGYVLGIDMLDEYYECAFCYNFNLVNLWSMYTLIFNETPIDILKKYYISYEEIEHINKIYDDIGETDAYQIIIDKIKKVCEEIRTKIMDKTRTIEIFNSLGIDRQTQLDFIDIIDKYCASWNRELPE